MPEPEQTTAQITLPQGWPDWRMSIEDRARELIGMLHDQGKLPAGPGRGVRLLGVQLRPDWPMQPWGRDLPWFGEIGRTIVVSYAPMRGGDDARDTR